MVFFTRWYLRTHIKLKRSLHGKKKLTKSEGERAREVGERERGREGGREESREGGREDGREREGERKRVRGRKGGREEEREVKIWERERSIYIS